MNSIFDSLLEVYKEIPKNEIKSINGLFSETFLLKIPKKIRKKIENELINFKYNDETLCERIELFIFSCYHISFKSLKVLVKNDLLSENSIITISHDDIAQIRGVGEKTKKEILAFKEIVHKKDDLIKTSKMNRNLMQYFEEDTISKLYKLNINDVEGINFDIDYNEFNDEEKKTINNLLKIKKDNDEFKVFSLFEEWKKSGDYSIGEILGIDSTNIDSLKFINNNTYSNILNTNAPHIGGKFLDIILTNNLYDISKIYELTYEQISNQLKLTARYEAKLKNLIINNIVIVKEGKVRFASPANYVYHRYANFVLKTFNEKDYLNCINNIEIMINKYNRSEVTIKELRMIMIQKPFIDDLLIFNKSASHAIEIFKNIYNGNRNETIDVLKDLYQNIVSNISIDEVINYLKKIEIFSVNDNNKVIIAKRKLNNYLMYMENERYQNILVDRLNGKTLEESSNKAGVTRERARQIIDKVLKNINEELVEDRYRIIFQHYNFTEEEFLEIFDVEPIEYYYLLNKYNKGEIAFSNFSNEEQFGLSLEILERIIEYKYKDYIIIDNEIIKKSKYEILEYLLKYFCKEPTKIIDFQDLYHEFIDEFNLSVNLKVDNKASFENTMERLDVCIYYPGKKVRYYPFSKYDWKHFYHELAIDEFMDKEISTFILFENQKDLMKDYDILDHFELHNIIRRTFESFNLAIEMSRNPHVKIGNTDFDYQILELLIELAPISQSEFVANFSKKYGIRQDTLLANTYLDVIEEYLQNGIYKINNDYLSDIDLTYLESKLQTNNFYFIDEIKKDYAEHTGKELLSTQYVFNQLGFKMGSSYIYSDKYSSFIDFMKKTIFNKDIVSITDLPYRMKDLGTFRSYTQKMIESHQYIEFEFEKFISISRLSQNGMSNEVIDDYINSLLSRLEEGKIYDFITILENDEDNIFKEFGFGLRFYESMFRRDKDNRRIHSQSVGGTLLIRKHEKINSFTDLLQQIIDEYRSFNIYDLIYYLKEEYHLETHRSFILERVKECDMYFNEIMEKIYIDNDYYYEELG